jgi:hypothetical protein
MTPKKGYRKFLVTLLITLSVCVIQILFQSETGIHSLPEDFFSLARSLVPDKYYIGLYEIND